MRYSEFKTEKEFKKFLRDNNLLMKEYFELYEPKFDLFTNQKIEYKSRDSYFNIDFVDKRHMAKWLRDQYKKDADDYIIKKIKKRINDKEWKFKPSQIECRSLRDIPALNVLNYHSNEAIWKKLNLISRFEYPEELVYEHDNLDKAIIGVDSREKRKLQFKEFEVIDSKFDFGDYSFMNEPYFCNTFIERKSIQDLWGTMGKGYSRFCSEIERALERNAYIIVIVDYSFSKAQSYNHNKRFSKMTAESIFHQIRKLLQTYPNIQFVFSGNRKKSVNLIKKIGLLGNNAKKYDLQFNLDMKKI